MKSRKVPRIVVSFLPGYASERLKFRGVMNYARQFGPWEFNITPEGRYRALNDLKTWKPDGFMGILWDSAIAEEIVRLQIPTVLFEPSEDELLPSNPLSRCCRVECDSELIGCLSAEFFLERRIRQLGFVGETESRLWVLRRERTFVQEAKKRNIPCHVFPLNPDKDANWETRQSRLRKWLLSLPKPIGICTSSDIRGRQILDCCLVSGIKVPDEVAVLGADNDEFFCMTSQPTLSSVLAQYELGGYEGARMLDQLLHGIEPVRRVFQYGVEELIQRESTRVMAVDDPYVAQALDYIRLSNGRGIQVSDIVERVGASRRTLETRFQTALGKSILDFVNQQRMTALRDQALNSSMTIKQLAAWAGLESTSHLSKLFRETFGMSIKEYRLKNGKRED